MLFECPSTYAPIKPIGKGAYGIVASANDVRTNQKVAIKKIGRCGRSRSVQARVTPRGPRSGRSP